MNSQETKERIDELKKIVDVPLTNWESKEQYIEWRKNWRELYALISKAVRTCRSYKYQYKMAGGFGRLNVDETNLPEISKSYDDWGFTELYSYKDWRTNSCYATKLIDLRKRSKILAQENYEKIKAESAA